MNLTVQQLMIGMTIYLFTLTAHAIALPSFDSEDITLPAQEVQERYATCIKEADRDKQAIQYCIMQLQREIELLTATPESHSQSDKKAQIIF